MNRQRLEIESVRDSMLAAAGRLDLTAGGVPFSFTAEPSTSASFGIRLYRARARSGCAERIRLRLTGSARAVALRNNSSPAGALFPEQLVHCRTIQRARESLRNRGRVEPAGEDRADVQTGFRPEPGRTGAECRAAIHSTERRTGCGDGSAISLAVRNRPSRHRELTS